MTARLKERYQHEVVPQLRQTYAYQNPHEVPRLTKIVVNMGVGEAIQNSKILDSAVSELALITGQKPLVTKSKKSIANFKLRAGMSIGCKVTLRQERMYEFLDRLINVALPRVRDFKGVPPDAFDGRGNYALGDSRADYFPRGQLRSCGAREGAWRHYCHHGTYGRGSTKLVGPAGYAIPRGIGGIQVGEEILDCESEPGTEIPRAGLSSLSDLRATTGILAEIPNVPHLFSSAGIAWRSSWSDQGQLVNFQLQEEG